MAEPPLWRCPTCGQTFVSRNMPHSCQVVALDDHFAPAPGLPEDVDAEVRCRLAEAYAVGEQRHLGRLPG